MNKIGIAIMIAIYICTMRTHTVLPAHLNPDKVNDAYDRGILDQEEININDQEEINVNKEYDFITISLGCNCHVGTYTRDNNIRAFAFPFDWSVTPFQALYHFIENDFKDFFKRENLIASSKQFFTTYTQSVVDRLRYNSFIENNPWVIDKQSGMFFNHDFSDNDANTINKYFQINHLKYTRRIKRFYTAINSGKHIYFIRFHDIDKPQSLGLYLLLKYKFPTTPFTLIVIGDKANEFNEDWNIPYIKNYYTKPDYAPFWQKLCQDIVARRL